MKKVLIFLLCVVIVVLGAVGVLYYKNKDYVEAFLLSRRYSSEEISKQITEKNKSFDYVLKDYIDNLPRPLTDEEKKEIESGNTSLYEVVGKIFKEESEKTDSPSDNKETAEHAEKVSPENEVKQKTAEYIGRMYALQDSFTGQLNGVISSAKSEYQEAMRNKNGRSTATIRSEILAKYAGTVTSMEGQCDAAVNSLISEFKDYLASVGQSSAVADSMYQAYLDKKMEIKVYYMSKL